MLDPSYDDVFYTDTSLPIGNLTWLVVSLYDMVACCADVSRDTSVQQQGWVIEGI